MTAKSDRVHLPRSPRANGSAWPEFVLLALLFGSVGAISWAIRGTTGWNGVDGAVVPGMAWGVLWYWAARRWHIDVRGVTLWLGLGIAIGGELGYGQYVSWIRGNFYAGDQVLSVAPATGFMWFAIVGLGWGAFGGIALGWSLNSGVTLHQWLVRLLAPVGAAMAGRILIQTKPAWFFPFFGAGIYGAGANSRLPAVDVTQRPAFMWVLWFVAAAITLAVWSVNRKPLRNLRMSNGLCFLGAICVAFALVWIAGWLFFPQENQALVDGVLDHHLSRTVYTNSQNALVVFWWIGALAVAAWQRDRATLLMGLIVGGGFSIGMPISAIWCLGYAVAPDYIDWWKMWEMNAGFNLGVLYLVALYLAARQPRAFKLPATGIDAPPITACWRAVASAAGVLLVWIFLYMEDGLVAGIFLGPVYAAAVCGFCWRGRQRTGAIFEQRQRRLTFVFCVFFLLFILLHGATSRLGVFLELYDEAAVDQYAWPAARIWLFGIVAAPLFVLTLQNLWQLSRTEQAAEIPMDQLTGRIVSLVMLIGLVGALTIWPSKIGVIYAALLLIAIVALLRIDRRPRLS